MSDPYPAFIDKYQPKIRAAILKVWEELRKSVSVSYTHLTLPTTPYV